MCKTDARNSENCRKVMIACTKGSFSAKAISEQFSAGSPVFLDGEFRSHAKHKTCFQFIGLASK